MARQLAILLLTVPLSLGLAAPAHAQGRGGGMRGGGFHAAPAGRIPGGRPAFAGRPAPIPVSRPGFTGHAAVVVRPSSPIGVIQPGFIGSFHGPVVAPFVGSGRVTVVRPARKVFVPSPFFGAFYSPFFWAPPVYAAPAYVGPDYVAPSVSPSEADLAYQVRQLRDEIQQLREQQPTVVTPPPPEPAPPPASDRASIPMILVFRDGHRQQVQNYAIVGETLWVLDEKTATSIPLSDLDLDATQKANQAQGLRFPVPGR